MPIFDNLIIKKIVFSALIFSFSFISTDAMISSGFIKSANDSLLALTMGNGGIFSSSLKIKNQSLTIGNGLSIPNKVSFEWSGGTKPYFVEYQTSSGWETVGGNVQDKKYTHDVPSSESQKRELCYRVGYMKMVKNVNTTYVSAPSCVQVLSGMIQGDVTTLDAGLKFKTVTLYEVSDDSNDAYKIVATYSGGKAPYAIHAQSGSKSWTPIGNTAEKTITALVPKTVTNGETNICVMMHYQKTVRNVTTQTVSLPYCTQLLSAVPDGGMSSTGAPVQNIRASNITHYNAKLTWTKSTEDIDGYAVYLEGELVAQTRTNSYTEQPILMPETTYSYAIRTIPKNTTPVEELPEVVGVAANAGIFNLTTKVVPPVPTRGEVKVLVIPVKLSTLTAQLPDSPNELRKKIFTNEDSLANFYNEASFGKIRISGQVVNEIVDVHNYGVDDLEELLKEKRVFVSVNLKVNKISSVYDPSKYDIVIYNMPAMDGAWGVVDRVTEASGVIKGRIFVNGIKNTHVYAHEFGHKLSFHHAGKSECFDEFSGHLECFEELDVYGDWSDIMSRFALYHPDSWRKAEVGWIRKKEITKNGTYDIIPTENSNSVMHYIERGSEKYYFDYRVPTAMEKNQEFGYEFNGGLYLKSVRYGTVERTGQKYYVTYNLTNTNEPLFNNNRYANFSDFRIWNLKEDQNKAKIFVRFLEDSIPKITSAYSYTKTFDKTSISWSAVDMAAGYELYRNSTTTAPIYTGNATKFLDTEPGQHTYYVRAYDAFTELPGKTYPLDFSDSKKAKFEKLSTTAPANLKALSNAGYKQSVITWDGVLKDGAKILKYELYRNSTESTPIYSGTKLTYTDNTVGQHTYFVRAARTFTDFPGDTYYTDMSLGVKTQYIPPPPPPPPSGSVNTQVQLTNPCPENYSSNASIVLTHASDLIKELKSVTTSGYITVTVNGFPLGDWYYDPYYAPSGIGRNMNNSSGKFYLPLNGNIYNSDRKLNGGKLNIKVQITDYYFDVIRNVKLYNSYVYEDVGGDCKVGVMKYTPQEITVTCPSPIPIYHKGFSELNKLQAMNYTSNVKCHFDKMSITNEKLLYPNYVSLHYGGGGYYSNGNYDFNKDHGVYVRNPKTE